MGCDTIKSAYFDRDILENPINTNKIGYDTINDGLIGVAMMMIDLLKPVGILRLPPRATTPCYLTIGLTSCVWSPRRTQVGLSIGQFQEAYDDKGSPWVTHFQKAHKMENHEIVATIAFTGFLANCPFLIWG